MADVLTERDEDLDPNAPVGCGGEGCSIPVTAQAYKGGAEPEPLTWQLPEEQPIALVYNKRPFAVMMATPADLADFGLGFSLAEQVIESPNEIYDLEVELTDAGIVVNMEVPTARSHALIGRRRTLEGRSSCGMCGVESLESIRRDPVKVSTASQVAAMAVVRAFEELPKFQPMNQLNRSVHAAGWCRKDGSIVMVREDVGRHCALDKLIGAMARAKVDPAEGFAVMSSRCSFELINKATAAGISLLATISAPTTLALTLARQAGLTLASATRQQGVVFFT